MKYHKIITLKDGRDCILRNGTEHDSKAVLDNFILVSGSGQYEAGAVNRCFWESNHET